MPKEAKWYDIEEDYQSHKENPEYWATYYFGYNLIQYAMEKEGKTERLIDIEKEWEKIFGNTQIENSENNLPF